MVPHSHTYIRKLCPEWDVCYYRATNQWCHWWMALVCKWSTAWGCTVQQRAVLGLFLSGSQQLPSLAGKSQHSEMLHRCDGLGKVMDFRHGGSFYGFIFVLFSLSSFVFFASLCVLTRPHSSFCCLVTHWDKGYLQSRGLALNLYKLSKYLVVAWWVVLNKGHNI